MGCGLVGPRTDYGELMAAMASLDEVVLGDSLACLDTLWHCSRITEAAAATPGSYRRGWFVLRQDLLLDVLPGWGPSRRQQEVDRALRIGFGSTPSPSPNE